MVQRQAAQPPVGRRDADPHPGADRVPEVVPVGELDRPSAARPCPTCGSRSAARRIRRSRRVGVVRGSGASSTSAGIARPRGAASSPAEERHPARRRVARGSSGAATAPSFASAVQQHRVVDRRLERPARRGRPAAPRGRRAGARRRPPRWSSSPNVIVALAGDQGGVARAPPPRRVDEPVVEPHAGLRALDARLYRCDPAWRSAGLQQGSYTDIRYETGADDAEGIAKITIARPEVRNAFRPETLIELSDGARDARARTRRSA